MVTRDMWIDVHGPYTCVTRTRVGEGYAVMLILHDQHGGHRSAAMMKGDFHGKPPNYPGTNCTRHKQYANGCDASGGIVRTSYPG